jgi:hypothetical protein
MTIAARDVLEDCRGVVDEIGGGVQGRAWRRRYITAVVLLRTVGYVLAKVDAKFSIAHKNAIDNAWVDLQRTRPQPEIFWSFIDSERQNIIHEYEIGAGQGATVHLGQEKPTELHYTLTTGPFAGRDQHAVLCLAIDWWEQYLSGIDQVIAKYR